MAKFSTQLRREMLSGGGLLAALNGGKLRIFCAASDPANPVATAVDAPASADDAETGTLMLELTGGGDGVTGLRLEADGVVVKKDSSQDWLCAGALHDGPVHYWRLVGPSDTGGQSQSEARVQGTVGIARGDMLASSLTVTQGAPWALNFFDIEAPAESGPLSP